MISALMASCWPSRMVFMPAGSMPMSGMQVKAMMETAMVTSMRLKPRSEPAGAGVGDGVMAVRGVGIPCAR